MKLTHAPDGNPLHINPAMVVAVYPSPHGHNFTVVLCAWSKMAFHVKESVDDVVAQIATMREA